MVMARGNAVEARAAAVPADEITVIATVIQRGVAGTVLESEKGTGIARGMVTTVAAGEIRCKEVVGISITEIEVGIEIGIGIGIGIEIGIVIGNEIGEAHRTIIGKETGLGGETAAARMTISIDELVDQGITQQIPKSVPSVGIIMVSEIGRERRPEKRRAWPTV